MEARRELVPTETFTLDRLDDDERRRLTVVNEALHGVVRAGIDVANRRGLGRGRRSEAPFPESVLTEAELFGMIKELYFGGPISPNTVGQNLDSLAAAWRILADESHGRKARSYAETAELYGRLQWVGGNSVQETLLRQKGEVVVPFNSAAEISFDLPAKYVDKMIVGYRASARAKRRAVKRAREKNDNRYGSFHYRIKLP